jgi:hypothetical protein
MFDMHPVREALFDMEDELSRAEGLVHALYELIAEKVDHKDPNKHEAMLTVRFVMRETIEKLDEKWKKVFAATKRLKQ